MDEEEKSNQFKIQVLFEIKITHSVTHIHTLVQK